MRRACNEEKNVRQIPWYSSLLHGELFFETIQREFDCRQNLFRRVGASKFANSLRPFDHIKPRHEFIIQQRYFEHYWKMYVGNNKGKSLISYRLLKLGTRGLEHTAKHDDSQLCGPQLSAFCWKKTPSVTWCSARGWRWLLPSAYSSFGHNRATRRTIIYVPTTLLSHNISELCGPACKRWVRSVVLSCPLDCSVWLLPFISVYKKSDRDALIIYPLQRSVSQGLLSCAG